MNWTEVGVQWLHILFGTFWFGGMLFSTYVVIPAIGRLPVEGRGAAMAAVGSQANRIVPWVALGAIVLGVVRGTVLGDIHDVSDLGTAYGIEWLVGLAAAVATLAWGRWVLNPAARRLAMGPPSPAKAAEMANLRRYTWIQMAGFMVIFTTMILMHYANGG
jgi:uncharacterized membrane protein